MKKRVHVLLAACLLAVPGLWAESVDTSRLVVLGGAAGETVCALGAEPRVVAADLSCTWPASLGKLPQVGYHRQLSAEGVLSLNPTVIIGTNAAGPPAALEQIRAAGIPVILLSAEPSLAAVLENIRKVGEVLACPEKAEELARSVEQQAEAVEALAAAEQRRPRVLFLMSAPSSDRFNVAGRGTAIEAIVTMSGGVPALDGFEGYKPVSAESIAAAAPDIILYPGGTQHGAGFSGNWKDNPSLASTPAVRNGQIHAVDLGLVAGFGPRVGEAVRELHGLFFPVTSQTPGGMVSRTDRHADDT